LSTFVYFPTMSPEQVGCPTKTG